MFHFELLSLLMCKLSKLVFSRMDRLIDIYLIRFTQLPRKTKFSLTNVHLISILRLLHNMEMKLFFWIFQFVYILFKINQRSGLLRNSILNLKKVSFPNLLITFESTQSRCITSLKFIKRILISSNKKMALSNFFVFPKRTLPI